MIHFTTIKQRVFGTEPVNYSRTSSLVIFPFIIIMLSACNTKQYTLQNAWDSGLNVVTESINGLNLLKEKVPQEINVSEVGNLSDGKSIKPMFLDFSNKNALENVRVASLFHPTVLSALAKIKSADATVEQVKALEKAQSSVSVSGGFSRDNGTTDPAALARLSVSKLLYDFGSTSTNIMSSQYLTDAANADMRLKAEEIALRAYMAWTKLGSYRKVKDIYSRGINLAEPLLGQIKNISTSGLADKASVLSAQKKYASLQLGFDEIKTELLKSEAEFLEYFPGVDISVVEPLNYSRLQLTDLETLEAEMNNNSIILKSLGFLIKSKKLEIAAVSAGKKPSLSLSGSATIPAEKTEEDTVANIGLLVSYTFSDGGRKQAQIESLDGELEGLLSEVKKAKLNEKTQLQILIQKYDADIKREVSLKSMVELAREVKETAKGQLVSGRSKIEDVMSAEVTLAQTQIDLINTQTDLQMTSIQIDGLVNGLLGSFN